MSSLLVPSGQIVFDQVAPVKLLGLVPPVAPERFALVKSTLVKMPPTMIALLRSAPVMLLPEKLPARRSAPISDALVRVTGPTIPYRLAPSKIAPVMFE